MIALSQGAATLFSGDVFRRSVDLKCCQRTVTASIIDAEMACVAGDGLHGEDTGIQAQQRLSNALWHSEQSRSNLPAKPRQEGSRGG
jgi:hypothetical protein